MRSTTILTLVILFFSLSLTANSDPVTIKLEQASSRNLVTVQTNNQLVELCQLEDQASYWIRAITTSGEEVNMWHDGEAVEDLLFTAEESCHTIQLVREGLQREDSQVVISVNCVTCEPEMPSRAPNLAVSGGQSALSLIQDVFIGGDCFEIQNASFIGNANGIGAFSNGGTSIGLDDGVIISTGNITNAPGPNNQGGAGNALGTGSHPDLAALANAQVFDATGISFQFTPTVPQIFFNYVFASEEYCEYVGAGFNDVFGFFISGPGINGGFLLNGENIAVIPGTTTAVAIDEVNHVSNTGFFVGNSGTCNSTFNMDDIQFDGFTTLLTAVANVMPCENYNIRLLIGDAGDAIFDSAVFLEANSFSAGGASAGEAISPTTGINVTYEACSDGYFVLQAAGDINTDREIDFNIAPFGTATPGVDYIPFPTSVTIPAGQTEIIIPITVIPDNIIEGQETIVLELQNSCSCSGTYIELIIEDVPPLSVEAFDIELCDGLPGQLDAIAFGGLPGYNYSWSDGSSGETISVSPTTSTTYAVTVTDECGSSAVTTANVIVNPPASAQMVGGGEFCGADIATDIYITFGGTGPWLFSYSLDGEFQEPIYTEENPYILTVSEPGFYFPESVISTISLCEGTVEGLVFIEISEFDIDVEEDQISCPGEDDGAINVTAMNGVTPYGYSWENLTTGTVISNNSSSLDDLPAGTYSVTVNDNDGCVDSTIVDIIEPDGLEVTASIASIPNCSDPNGGSVDLSLVGGTPGFSFLWSNGDTVQNPENLGAGDYGVTITDFAGCQDSTQITVNEDITPPVAIASVQDTITCFIPEIDLSGAGSSTGSIYDNSWAGPGLVAGNTTLDPTVNAAGEYILTVTNLDNGCISQDTVQVTANQENPTAMASDDLLNCYEPEKLLDATGTSTGDHFTYQWSGPGLAGSTTVIDPLVFSPGDYTLIVTDTENGCQDTTSIVVLEDKADPVIDAGSGAQLDCFLTEYDVSATASGNTANFVYEWTTADGNIISGGDGLNPIVDAAGTYQLVVTDTINGCSSSDQLMVTQDPSLPVALIDGGAPLTCAVTSIQLDAENSTVGTGGSFTWSTTGGNFMSGQNTLSPMIDAPGTYYLIITGGGSVCEDTATVIIPIDTLSPALTPAPAATLTCDVTDVELSATATTSSGQMLVDWFGPAGLSILSDDSLTISAVNPGNYLLVVNDPVTGCISTVETLIDQDITLPTIAVAPTATITCSSPEIAIDASSSSAGANFIYEWQDINGTTLTEVSSTLSSISTPGIYSFKVSNTDNGCVDSTTVEVLENINYPIVSIDPADELNCSTTVLSIGGNATSTASTLSYQWESADGNIITGSTALSPLVDEPGTYILAVTDDSNDCETRDTIVISQDIELPSVNAGMGAELTCSFTSFDLSGSATANGPVEILWLTNDGNIVDGANTYSPTVNSAGTYTMQVTNLSNGCIASNDVLMTSSTDHPNISIAPAEILDCDTESTPINASASDSGNNFVYEWTTTDGNIVSATDVDVITVDAPGIYNLQITNTLNDCVSNAMMEVEEDVAVPFASAGSTAILNCYNPSLSLNGIASSQGTEFTYEWATTGGNIISGLNSLTPEVDAPGTYQILVTNTINQCTSTDEVVITEDFIYPAAAVANPAVLNCTLEETNLDGTSSSQGALYEYLWTTSTGHIVSGETNLNPLIDEPGIYQLDVLNTENGCLSTTSVAVDEDIQLPVADAGLSPTLTCAVTNVNLDAGNSSQGAFFYEWSGPGIMSGMNSLTPNVNEPGLYYITVTDLNNNCTSQDVVAVSQDIAVPDLVIADPSVLNCELEEQELDATNSSQGGVFQYNWTVGGTGNIVQGAQSPNPLIDAPGIYSLVILNTDNGCSSMESVTVTQDIAIPEPAAADPAIITCAVPDITIDASASSSGSIFDYQWTTNNGNIIGGVNTLTPSVDEGGTYELLITNTQNLCTNTLSVDVIKDVEVPIAEAGQTQTLNCILGSITLSGAGSSTGDFSYEWFGTGIISGQSTLTPEVEEPGVYSLLVTNNFNGCTSTDQVLINQDLAQPVAAIASPAILNCAVESQNLNATNTNQGDIFEYEWTTVGTGNIIDGENTLTPLVDQPGTYTLFVVNTENGCTDTEEITVIQDIEIPELLVEEPAIITCAVPDIQIDASASSSGNEFEYLWTTTDGNIVSGATSLLPTVNEGGNYELLITNTDNHCTNLLLIEVAKDVELPVAEAGQTQELNCDIATVTLDADGSSTGNFSYQWSGPGVEEVSDFTTSTSEPGTFVLTVTNNFNGCVSTDQVVITQDIAVPQVIIAPPGILTCDVTNLTIDASNSSQGSTMEYQWTTSNGNIIDGADALQAVIDEPGQYVLTIFNAANECENNLMVNVNQDIVDPVAEAGDNYLMDCWDPTDELNGQGSSAGADYVYQWSSAGGNIISGGNTLNPTIDAPGVYTLLVTDTGNGCTDTDEVFITQTIPAAVVDVIQPPCYGDPGHIYIPEVAGGTAPFVYSIDGGNEFFSGASFTNIEPGNYDIVVQDINGCEYDSDISIEQPDSMVVLITVNETEILFGEEHQVVAQVNIPEEEISQIIWNNAASLSCDDCLMPIASPFYTTDYLVDVISVDGCADQARLRIFVDREKAVYVPNIFSPNNDGSNDLFYPFARAGSVVNIRQFQIFNRWGEPVYEVYNFQPNDPTYGWDGSFRGELMNSAVFVWFIEVEFVDGSVEIFEGDVTLFR
jgi:gliding motility-associated-like protein